MAKDPVVKGNKRSFNKITLVDLNKMCLISTKIVLLHKTEMVLGM